ncbi:hypothetical protein CP967_00165 [Streptomyces nitrosporeus]|uniref:Uncharacterized protein n=1 Tax=Streptomyces nitrosporeus TaxID=28894 RepID=A0A5J6F2G6_9ACTN|nr:hypothetical protein CP967_00165 [Streptomyces nitrosporeus]
MLCLQGHTGAGAAGVAARADDLAGEAVRRCGPGCPARWCALRGVFPGRGRGVRPPCAAASACRRPGPGSGGGIRLRPGGAACPRGSGRPAAGGGAAGRTANR